MIWALLDSTTNRRGSFLLDEWIIICFGYSLFGFARLSWRQSVPLSLHPTHPPGIYLLLFLFVLERSLSNSGMFSFVHYFRFRWVSEGTSSMCGWDACAHSVFGLSVAHVLQSHCHWNSQCPWCVHKRFGSGCHVRFAGSDACLRAYVPLNEEACGRCTENPIC